MLKDLSQISSIVGDKWEFNTICELAEHHKSWRELALAYHGNGYHLSMRATTTAMIAFLTQIEQLEFIDAAPKETNSPKRS